MLPRLGQDDAKVASGDEAGAGQCHSEGDGACTLVMPTDWVPWPTKSTAVRPAGGLLVVAGLQWTIVEEEL